LGVQFNTEDEMLRLPQNKITLLCTGADKMLRDSAVSPRFLRAYNGQLTFAMHYVPFGRANTRPLQWLLKTLWDWKEETLDVLYPFPCHFSLPLRLLHEGWRGLAIALLWLLCVENKVASICGFSVSLQVTIINA
jgi:hypothetical protein